MLEEIEHWLYLLHEGEYESLEEELEQMRESLIPALDPEDIPEIDDILTIVEDL